MATTLRTGSWYLVLAAFPEGKVDLAEGTSCLMLYIWSLSMKGKVKSEGTGRRSGSDQEPTKRKDKHSSFFRTAHPTLPRAAGSQIGSGCWDTRKGPIRTWKWQNMLLPFLSQLFLPNWWQSQTAINPKRAHYFFPLSTTMGTRDLRHTAPECHLSSHTVSPIPWTGGANDTQGRGAKTGISILSPKMQPAIQCCLRKAQNVWLYSPRQCAKNCFVLNKGKRYIRLKIPSHHSQKAM